MKAHLEKLRRDAAECAIIRDLATDPKKRELFTKLAEHMSVLASEVESAIAKDTDKCRLSWRASRSLEGKSVTTRSYANNSALKRVGMK
jgi:hypothetical protein